MHTEERKSVLWIGRVLSGLVFVLLVFSGVMKVAGSHEVLENFTGKFGYPASAVSVIGAIEIAVVLLYAIPRTQVLGAILVTGYLGGAVATHARLGDPMLIGPLLLGVFAWGGLYLRSTRLRSLLPLTQ
jgi:hypothetical protein